ncbi:MAG TPA: hypothetical protein VL551_34075 [Actinospica sp.]|jgi:hypothetical protein|nr:hypothetical protein [Actinospica sp.]
MNTPPTFTTTDTSCTAAIARTLRADGWTNALDERAEPAQSREIRPMASPDGTLNLHAREVSGGRCFTVLTGARTAGRRRRSWSAELFAPSSVVLAVISAAGQAGTCSDPGSIEAHLEAAGWHEQHDESDEDPDEGIDDEGGPLVRTWASPDGARSVTWYGPDDDPAFWSIYRSRPEGGGIRARLSQHAPAPVIAAAALAD